MISILRRPIFREHSCYLALISVGTIIFMVRDRGHYSLYQYLKLGFGPIYNSGIMESNGKRR